VSGPELATIPNAIAFFLLRTHLIWGRKNYTERAK
jgi:hypothetical protein